jgi:putative membrane protein
MTGEGTNELASERTDLAEDRTLLANERTFAGWMRTGLSSVGIGLGFHALFNAMLPPWVPRLISTAFLLFAIFVFWAAERRAAKVCRRLEATKVETFGGTNLKITAAVLTAATLALVGAIWLLPIGEEN